MSTPADPELLARIAAGDRDAFGLFYDRYAPILFAFCLRGLEDARDAEDVLQEAFVRAWHDARRFDATRAPVKTWLFTIARGRALDRRRSRHAQQSSAAPDESLDRPVAGDGGPETVAPRDAAFEAELEATDEWATAGTAPPPELKERIFRQIRGQPDEGLSLPPRRVSSGIPDRGLATMVWALGVAASFMLAAAFAALWYATRTDLGVTRANVAQLEGMLHDRDRDLKAKEAELSWLKDPRVQVALLKGLESNPTAKAKLLWHPATKQGILWVGGLPSLPPEQSYELWAFVGDQPVPAGTFDARPDGATVVPIGRQENLGEAPVKFAVSVEPKGGAPAPTGAIVLVGERF